MSSTNRYAVTGNKPIGIRSYVSQKSKPASSKNISKLFFSSVQVKNDKLSNLESHYVPVYAEDDEEADIVMEDKNASKSKHLKKVSFSPNLNNTQEENYTSSGENKKLNDVVSRLTSRNPSTRKSRRSAQDRKQSANTRSIDASKEKN